MRNALIRGLAAAARSDPRLMVLTADLGYKIFDAFADEFPGRWLNVGVAEANMIGVASGLAMGGMRPCAYSIATFITLRCLEQVRNDVCYHNLPVTLLGVGGGFSYGHNGPTHHAMEDIALMRVLPNMTVICPGDAVETELAVQAAAAHNGPVYLRIGRSGESRVHEQPPAFRIGEAITIRSGGDCALISTGSILPVAAAAARQLSDSGIACRVVHMHTVKPLDAAALRACFAETRLVFTVEEHSPVGGLGAAVSEWAAVNRCRGLAYCFAAEDRFAQVSGSQDYFREHCGLEAGHIAAHITKRMREEGAC